VLKKLPKSLDETYERVLIGIDESNQEDVYRLLQCLVVSIRPLRVEELAEVLAIEVDDSDGIPKLNPDWRWEDQEESLRAACSSLIAIVDTGFSRVVQFSHFSVKEFLTSPRLASSSIGISCYHISLEPAHIILAQTCLGVLLRLPADNHVNQNGTEDEDDIEDEERPKNGGDDFDDHDSVGDSFPLAEYAARHWIDHARFGNVSSHVSKGMELLFDPNKPHFATWRRLDNIDTSPGGGFLYNFAFEGTSTNVTPLYCAALSGLRDLAEHLIVNHLQDVNARGGRCLTPLVATLGKKHFQLAELLYKHGAVVDVRGSFEMTPMDDASFTGDVEVMQWLIDHGADTKDCSSLHGLTPLHYAAESGRLEAARLLLQHKAGIDAHADDWHGCTPLHRASEYGRHDVVRLLLSHGANANALTVDGSTPLHVASRHPRFGNIEMREGKLAVARLLLEHGVYVGAKDSMGMTALQVVDQDHQEMIKLLSHIAN
jgi:ankyrin repeat protein